MRRARNLKLAHRFTLVFSLVVLMVVGVLSVLAELYMSRSLRRQTELRARSLSLSLAAVARPFLLNYDDLTLQQMADATLEEPDLAYVVILDKEGKVAGFSGHRDRQGLMLGGLSNLRALNADAPRTQFESLADSHGRTIQVVESVVPVRQDEEGGQRWGTIRVGLSLARLKRDMLVTRLLLLLVALGGFMGAVFASNLLAARVARPLAVLVDAATDLERGSWNARLSIRTGDEIETLAGRFASAAQSLDRQKKALLAAKEELTALNATLEDKVQRRTAELATSREKYRLLVEGSPDAFVLLEQDRLAFANRAFCRIFEYPPDAAILENLRWTQIVHPEFHRMARDHFRRAQETMEGFRAELTGLTRAGRPVELEVRGRGVRYRGGTAVELVLADVGEKRRLLRQVVQSERLRAMGEMTAMVAHNFNNLLAVVVGRTQLLLQRSGLESIRPSLEVIRSSAKRAGDMVSQLQEYFWEQVDLSFGDVDLVGLIREVAGEFEDRWRTARPTGGPAIAIRQELNPVPMMFGAEPLLRDVLRHVFLNAAESMARGGEIRVRTEANETSASVIIEDDGIGMSPEVLRRAFDPFFTTKGSRTRGLGLSTSFGIIQRHDGRMDVQSEAGSGTKVEISLPIRGRPRRILPFPGEYGSAFGATPDLDNAAPDDSSAEEGSAAA